MTRLAKKRKNQIMQTIDLSGRSRIVIEPSTASETVACVQGQSIKKYDYGFILEGANPSREERRQALRNGIATHFSLAKSK